MITQFLTEAPMEVNFSMKTLVCTAVVAVIAIIIAVKVNKED